MLYLDSLIQFSGRLKNVHNPYNSLAPTPVQISESIMLFQEKGSLFSSRVRSRQANALVTYRLI